MTKLPIILKDNSDITENKEHPIIMELLNKNLSYLDKENFIIFPTSVKESEDLGENNFIFESKNDKIYTCNIAGIIKKENDEIQIKTRFFNNNNQTIDYFLQYMLKKVLNYNITKNTTQSDNTGTYHDLLVYLFPFYLKRAMKKGLYKEYINKRYNDFNVKGSIDVIQNINKNIPFSGKIAYKVREFSYDNKITQIIRHTLEKIKREYNFEFLDDKFLKENIYILQQNTKSYSKFHLDNILQDNIKNPVRHGYFSEYFPLQKLCIQILKSKKVEFAEDSSEVHGILIDDAWQWEKYLNT